MTEPDPALAWLPGNAVEAELYSALAADDRQRFFQIIRDAPWFLPALPDAPDGPRFLTQELFGETFLLVFTSVRTLANAVGAAVSGYTVTGYRELSERWPVPSWRLAVNAGTPVDAWVTLAALGEAADGTRVVPTLARRDPEDDPRTDAALDAYLTRLFQVELLVPAVGEPLAYEVARRDGQLFVDVFTSEHNLVAVRGPGTRWLRAFLGDLAARWPSSEYALAIDPGTDVALVIDGERVPGLLLWLSQADAEDSDGAQVPDPGPDPGPVAEPAGWPEGALPQQRSHRMAGIEYPDRGERAPGDEPGAVSRAPGDGGTG